MFYVYVLKSLKDGKFYTGYTNNLERRFDEHNAGLSKATKHRGPFELVYYEASRNSKDALHRERYLKTTYGKRYLRTRMAYDLRSQE